MERSDYSNAGMFDALGGLPYDEEFENQELRSQNEEVRTSVSSAPGFPIPHS
jgi:hypothetical protein